MTTPFLLKIGFSKIEIANIVKTYGLFSTLAGVFIGGWLAKQIGLVKLMVIGCIIQVISNLAFILLSIYGYNTEVLMLVITIENFCSGISNAALLAYISLLCSREFTASQYAVLSVFATFGRTTLSASAGYVAQSMGWINFFVFSAVLSLPVLFFITAIRKTIPVIGLKTK
jgi:PAT family beta-lactamase induction signal transducer AmpG